MKNTALLVMDYQVDILKMVGNSCEPLLKTTKALLKTARDSGVPVIYVKVAFRAGYPEVSPKNKGFAAAKQSQRMLLANPGTDIHAEVAPLDNEVVVVKHRVGAFQGTDLQTVLRAQGIEHLVLAGISSSGVVLSTLRYAADLDYRISVVADACADGDSSVHECLMQKVFPKQADVINADAAHALLRG